MRIQSKKGLSPLLATILLMAFVVALGSVIMSWSDTGETATEQDQTICNAVTVQIQEACIEENQIRLSVRNTGRRIDGLEIILQNQDIETNIRLPSSSLVRNEVLERTIPAIVSETIPTSIHINPLLRDTELVTCTSRSEQKERLPLCN